MLSSFLLFQLASTPFCGSLQLHFFPLLLCVSNYYLMFPVISGSGNILQCEMYHVQFICVGYNMLIILLVSVANLFEKNSVFCLIVFLLYFIDNFSTLQIT